MYNALAQSPFMDLSNHHHCLFPKLSCHFKQEVSNYWAIIPHHPAGTLGSTVCMNLPILDTCGITSICPFVVNLFESLEVDQGPSCVGPCSGHQNFISYYGWVILCCISVAHFFNPFVSQWTFEFYLPLATVNVLEWTWAHQSLFEENVFILSSYLDVG